MQRTSNAIARSTRQPLIDLVKEITDRPAHFMPTPRRELNAKCKRENGTPGGVTICCCPVVVHLPLEGSAIIYVDTARRPIDLNELERQLKKAVSCLVSDKNEVLTKGLILQPDERPAKRRKKRPAIASRSSGNGPCYRNDVHHRPELVATVVARA